MSQNKSGIFFGLTAIGLGLFLGLFLFEAYFILFPSQIPPRIQVMAVRGPFGHTLEKYNTVYTPTARNLKLKAGDVEIKNHPEFPDHSLRVKKLETLDWYVRDPHPTGHFDVVACGDSFTFGYGVPIEQSFVEVMERLTGLNILNAGVPYWDATEVRLFIEHVGVALKPRTILYFLYANDISDEVARLNRNQKSNAVEATPASSKMKLCRMWLSKHSVAYEGIKLWLTLGDYKNLKSSSLMVKTKSCEQEMLNPPFLQGIDHDFSLDHVKGVKIVEDNIEKMSMLTKKAHCKLIVFYIPLREQVYSAAILQDGQKEFSSFFDRPQKELAVFTKQAGISFFDLTPALQKKSMEHPLYFNFDRHLTGFGHSVVAEFASDIIKGQI